MDDDFYEIPEEVHAKIDELAIIVRANCVEEPRYNIIFAKDQGVCLDPQNKSAENVLEESKLEGLLQELAQMSEMFSIDYVFSIGAKPQDS